jgi:hypothetical protein
LPSSSSYSSLYRKIYLAVELPRGAVPAKAAGTSPMM